jgi:cysteine desulfurase/selenocysteine lyase
MIYLNNAATSYPKPKSVVKAVKNYFLQAPYKPGRGTEKNKFDVLTQCRSKIAEFFHIDDIFPIILTSGSTAALNMTIQGLVNKQNNKHCITSTIEHNSVLRPLNHL